MVAAKKNVVNVSKKRSVEATDVARINALVPVDVAQWLNVYAASNNMTVALALTELLSVHMDPASTDPESD